MDNNPLVSICVITYNSSAYVKETLDSILQQDYLNCEVIISDDCSNDSTPEICNEWVAVNKHRFIRCEFIQTTHNKGICGNYNNVWPKTNGTWIKFIAGDDRLKPNCISGFVKGIESNRDLMCCLRENFRNDSDERWISGEQHLRYPNQLYKVIATHPYGIVCGATMFVKKTLLETLGGFDERFPLAEDYPLCMKYLLMGNTIKQIEEVLIEYRNYASVSGSGNPRFIKSHTDAMIEYLPKAALYCNSIPYWFHFKIYALECKYSHNSFLKRFPIYLLKLFDAINYKNKILRWIKK